MPEKTRKREVSARRAAAISAILCARSGGIFCAFVCYKKLYAASADCSLVLRAGNIFASRSVSIRRAAAISCHPHAQIGRIFCAFLCYKKLYAIKNSRCEGLRLRIAPSLGALDLAAMTLD